MDTNLIDVTAQATRKAGNLLITHWVVVIADLKEQVTERLIGHGK